MRARPLRMRLCLRGSPPGQLSGGSGAPGWTLEAAGLNPANFHASHAAILQNTWGDGRTAYPKMIWPTNYGKYACATMFTLFFGGNT